MVKKLLKKTVKHLEEDIVGYRKNIKKGVGNKKQQLHEIKEDIKLIKEIKKTPVKPKTPMKPTAPKTIKKKK